MIYLCDPICKGFGHDKVNCGFIYGLTLTFPNEPIRMYAHPSHLVQVEAMLKEYKINVPNIEYIPIEFEVNYQILNLVRYFFLLRSFFQDAINSHHRCLFLSYNPALLCLIKTLKTFKKFRKLKFAFVLHGGFEHINTNPQASFLLPLASLPTKDWRDRIGRQTVCMLAKKSVQTLYRLMGNLLIWKMIKFHPSEKKALLWRNSTDYHYIALASHIIPQARKHIGDQLNIFTITHPIIFRPPLPTPQTSYPIFATFGFGDSLMMYNIATLLSHRKIQKPYEIRIIGMDHRGVEGMKNITCTSNGQPLERKEMELHVKDVSFMLILYQQNRYQLSCSGSPLEALCYTKPILHFENDCIRVFNKPDNPIGFESKTLNEYVDKMVEIIENFDQFQDQIANFRKNIITVRNQFLIENATQTVSQVLSLN